MVDEQGSINKSRLQWFKEANFGLFIHWGLYAIPAGVWKGKKISSNKYAEQINLDKKIPNQKYEKLADQFNPVKFDAEEWVLLAKNAGMKYIVITAKHQDGFAMFKSKVSSYNIVDATPWGRDPMKELAAACQKEGLKFCFYYSHARDYHHPGANWNDHGNTWDFPQQTEKDFLKYFNEKVKPQVRELLTNYGSIGLMWFDVPYKIPFRLSKELRELVLDIQPGCLINGRIGNNQGDYENLGDNEIAHNNNKIEHPWESCITMNDNWGYCKHDNNWKSSKKLIENLVEVVQKGGNYLLNVGPTAEGVFPEPAVKRLNEIGKWIKNNNHKLVSAE